MRVCSWNIWSKGSGLHPRHWIACAHELSSESLDLIALQEVDCHWGERTEGADVTEEMASLLNFHFFFCPSIVDRERRYGNAVLSRFPVLESGRVELSPQVAWDRANHETEPRTVAWVRVERPEPAIFLSTHLANALHFASTRTTMAQAERLTGLVSELSEAFLGHKIVLCGDFNLEPEAPEITLLESVIPRRSGSEPTWPVQPFEYKGWQEDPPPRFAVDHIFCSSPMRTWLGQSRLSDHLPLFGQG